MWIAKIEAFVPEDILWQAASKFNVIIHILPIKHYVKNNKVYYVMSCILEGEESNKRMCIKELKNNRWTVHLDSKGDYVIAVTYRSLAEKEETKQSIFFDPSIIYVTPAKIFPTGKIEAVFGSWDKKIITDKLKWCSKYYKTKLISLKNEKMTTIGMLTAFSLLTKKQKTALQLAVKNGYYEYPRKTELKELASMIGVSFSTYKAHLHKAEKHIIPFLLANVK